MPKRIAVNTLIVYRDNQRKKIMPGETVDLTADELTELNEVAPGSIRKPINESPMEQKSAGKNSKTEDKEI